ncbi:UNVERIFIED_CONTAM: hypothetical protein HHA_271110 [Hammondia hammondi]|eukprot:XP_008882481.1 hypothetical protein HHA_271110 [Hammondia hammondi]
MAQRARGLGRHLASPSPRGGRLPGRCSLAWPSELPRERRGVRQVKQKDSFRLALPELPLCAPQAGRLSPSFPRARLAREGRIHQPTEVLDLGETNRLREGQATSAEEVRTSGDQAKKGGELRRQTGRPSEMLRDAPACVSFSSLPVTISCESQISHLTPLQFHSSCSSSSPSFYRWPSASFRLLSSVTVSSFSSPDSPGRPRSPSASLSPLSPSSWSSRPDRETPKFAFPRRGSSLGSHVQSLSLFLSSSSLSPPSSPVSPLSSAPSCSSRPFAAAVPVPAAVASFRLSRSLFARRIHAGRAERLHDSWPPSLRDSATHERSGAASRSLVSSREGEKPSASDSGRRERDAEAARERDARSVSLDGPRHLGAPEIEEKEQVLASRLRGSYAASSLPLPAREFATASSSASPLSFSQAEELKVIEELETRERQEKATEIQKAMQRLCRMVISRTSAPLDTSTLFASARKADEANPSEATGGSIPSARGDAAADEEHTQIAGMESEEMQTRVIKGAAELDETHAGRTREKELRRTHMRSQFAWIAVAVDLPTLMAEDEKLSEAVNVLASMECPVIIRTKKLQQQLVPLSHGSTARIRQASKKLREALGIPEVLVCRGCVKKSKCPLYRQPPSRVRSSAATVYTKDLLYVLFGQYMVCRLYTRGVDSKTVWAESDERTAYSKQLSLSLLPSTMNSHDLDMGLFAIKKISEKVRERIQEDREKTARIAAAAQRAGLGDEVQFNPLSLKAFRAFIEDGQARRSEKQEKLKEARALKMPLWVRDSVRPLPDTQLTKFQRKAIQFHRLAVDEPEPDCPLEERLVWVHESEEAAASEERDEEKGKSPKIKEEEDAQQAVAAEAASARQTREPVVLLRERGARGDAGVSLPSLEDLPIQRRFAWRSPEGFPLRQRTLRFNLFYHYYLDRLKSQASKIPRFDLSAKNEEAGAAAGSGAAFSEELNAPEPPTLLPAPQGGYSAVPLSSFSSDDDGVHPLLHVDPKSLKGVAVYRHLSVRQMVESQQRVERLWRTAALFEDLPVIHTLSEREEFADQSSGDSASLLASLPRLPHSARVHLRELERTRAEELRRADNVQSDKSASPGVLEGDTCMQQTLWTIRPPPDRTRLFEAAEGDEATRGLPGESETKSLLEGGEGDRGRGDERGRSSAETRVKRTECGQIQLLHETVPAWLKREAQRWNKDGEASETETEIDEGQGDKRASATRGYEGGHRGAKDEVRRGCVGTTSGARAGTERQMSADVNGERERGDEPGREESETEREDENDEALDEVLWGDEQRRSREMWRAAKKDRAAEDARKAQIEREFEVPPSIADIHEQAQSLRRAAHGDVRRARGRGRRRTVAEMLEDAAEEEKRFQRWQAARRQAREAAGEATESEENEERGPRIREEKTEAAAKGESGNKQKQQANLDRDEPFHMGDEGGIHVSAKGAASDRLRFARSTFTVVDCTTFSPRSPPSPSSPPYASSSSSSCSSRSVSSPSSPLPVSLPLLSRLDMHARSAGERQSSEDGRALQELESLDEETFEVFVKPGRLETRGVSVSSSETHAEATESPETRPRCRDAGDSAGTGAARGERETEAAHSATGAATACERLGRGGGREQEERTEGQMREEGDTDDEDDLVFRSTFRVPLESDGGRPLGVDREEVARSHMELARMQKTWRQNEDFLITRNVLYPKFVDLSQDAYGAHSPEGKEVRKQQLSANRANPRAASVASPTRRMPVSGLMQATLPDMSALMKATDGGARKKKENERAKTKLPPPPQPGAAANRVQTEADTEASFRDKYGVVKDMAKVYLDKVKNHEMGGTVVNPAVTELQRSETLHRLILKKEAAREQRRRSYEPKTRKTGQSKLDEILRRPPVTSTAKA